MERLREHTDFAPETNIFRAAADEIKELRAAGQTLVEHIAELNAEIEKLRTKLADPVEVRRLPAMPMVSRYPGTATSFLAGRTASERSNVSSVMSDG